MDPRQAIRTALREQRDAEEPRLFFAEADTDDDIGAVEVAEYIIHLLALDTYIRYVEEFTGEDDPIDDVIKKGFRVLRMAESDLEAIVGHMDESLSSPAQKNMLKRTLRRRVTNPSQIGMRALNLRTLLEIGGAKTKKAIFKQAKEIKKVRVAITSSVMEDADAALDKLAAITVTNSRIRAWIDLAANRAQAKSGPENLVMASAQEVTGKVPELMAATVQELAASGADEASQASEVQAEKIDAVQMAATEAAQRSMDRSGEPDVPLTKSEVIGVATAAVAAVTSDPSNPSNVPESLRGLDDEQLAAAMTDGKVLIAAGAGAGKSTTLVARVKYLVRERRVDPSKIMVTSFNTRAASELADKLGDAEKGLGAGGPKAVGTMHSLFGRFVKDYGTPREKAALSAYSRNESYTARAVQAMWKDCYPDLPVPKAKQMKLRKTMWAGNNISTAQAQELADQETGEKARLEAQQASRWYMMYEGLKGALDEHDSDGEVTKAWKPPCEGKAKASVDEINDEKESNWRSRGSNPKYKPKSVKTIYEAYMATVRPGNKRVGDFDDMIGICHNVMERNPQALKAIQKRFDHILVDECQDLNEVQHGVIRMMSGHISDGSDGKSLWMVGDDKQSIYAFRGARPDLFTGLDGKEGWKTRMMRTNYRCAPEIVNAANKLIAHNTGQIPMQANAAPGKVTGVASIEVKVAATDAAAAISTIEKIKSQAQEFPEKDQAEFFKKNAILMRTNKETNAFETACIMRGIPYARKGAGSFLGSRETKAMLGYTNLVMGGSDPAQTQKALANCINSPNRFYKNADDTKAGVDAAVRDYAKSSGSYIKDVDPAKAIHDPDFQSALAERLSGRRRGTYFFRMALEKVQSMAGTIQDLQMALDDPNFTTKDLFDEILGGFEGETNGTDANGVPIKVTTTLREDLTKSLNNSSAGGDDDDDEDDENSPEKLGNIGFLYLLMEPDPTDPDDTLQPPTTPAGFKAKMDRLSARAEDLRYDLDWNPRTGDPNDKMAKLSEKDRKKPPAVYIGTAHSVKGLEWPNAFVQMPAGKFPFEKPRDKNEPPPTEDELKQEAEDLETERRLAYVAMTRAADNLTIICPSKVGGQPAGISPFVFEAGLKEGENVDRPPEAEDGPPAMSAPVEDLPATALLAGEPPDEEEGPEPRTAGDWDFEEGK